MGEFDIIERYFARRTGRADVLLGIGDDAAVLDVRGDDKLVVAVDTILEGVHFLAGAEGADVGYRALAVNLSDLAAMGAKPVWMTLSLSMPEADETWLAAFAAGLFELADRHGVELVGGDTVRGPRVVTIQVGGSIEPDRWLTRSGAKPGDLLLVSGAPGEAAAGLALLQRQIAGGEAAGHLRQRFLRPQPRIALGRRLRTIASAAMDVSDGLLVDLEKLCTASGCGARVDVDALPVSSAMRQLFDGAACTEYALGGGDDYEILFTVAADRMPELQALLPHAEAPITQIGVITAGSGVQCVRGGQPFTPKRRGYDHFGAAADPGDGRQGQP